MTRTLAMLLVALFVFSLPVAAKFFVSAEEINKYGVNYRQLEPVNLGFDGSFFAATEIVSDVRKKGEGITRILRIFRFKDEALQTIDSVDLPIAHLTNICLNDKKPEACVIGNYGNKIMIVNLDTLSIRTIFEFKKGRGGIKAGPFLMCDKGQYYSSGWTYDKEQYWKGDYLVRYKIGEKGAKFSRTADLHELYRERFDTVGRVRAYYYVSGERFFFNLIKPKERKTSILTYNKGQVSEVAEGHLISMFVGTNERLFYRVRHDKENFEYFVKSVEGDNKVWPIKSRTGERLTYPFLIKKTLVVAALNMKHHTLNAYIGKEEKNYHLSRFIKNESIGPMKISPDAKVYILMTHKGLHVGNLP